MKVLVLGSGVVGVSTAWYLAKAGHEVTVVDRLDTPATETSYANARQERSNRNPSNRKNS